MELSERYNHLKASFKTSNLWSKQANIAGLSAWINHKLVLSSETQHLASHTNCIPREQIALQFLSFSLLHNNHASRKATSNTDKEPELLHDIIYQWQHPMLKVSLKKKAHFLQEITSSNWPLDQNTTDCSLLWMYPVKWICWKPNMYNQKKKKACIFWSFLIKSNVKSVKKLQLWLLKCFNTRNNRNIWGLSKYVE